MKGSKSSHVVAHTGGGMLECRACGKTYRFNMPVPISIWSAAATEFLKIHERCGPAQNKTPAQSLNSG
jgi:hypothetical protein